MLLCAVYDEEEEPSLYIQMELELTPSGVGVCLKSIHDVIKSIRCLVEVPGCRVVDGEGLNGTYHICSIIQRLNSHRMLNCRLVWFEIDTSRWLLLTCCSHLQDTRSLDKRVSWQGTANIRETLLYSHVDDAEQGARKADGRSQ